MPRIAVIADLHYSQTVITTCRVKRWGHAIPGLLDTALQKLNRETQPDVLLLAGDIVNDANDTILLHTLRKHFDSVSCPWFAIPGNHDPSPDLFYRIFPPCPDYMDIQGVRIIPFPYDLQTATYQAFRTKKEISRLQQLAADKHPSVMLQHVPLFPPGRVCCPYNYENAEQIISAAQNCNVRLSISGHFHAGFSPFYDAPFPILAVPALCECNFPFAVIDLDENGNMLSYSLSYVHKNEP